MNSVFTFYQPLVVILAGTIRIERFCPQIHPLAAAFPFCPPIRSNQTRPRGRFTDVSACAKHLLRFLADPMT